MVFSIGLAPKPLCLTFKYCKIISSLSQDVGTPKEIVENGVCITL
nr:MAG TPA: hypothetical protein [Ackermannviridae sp.]